MNEVDARVLRLHLQALDGKGLPRTAMVEGTPYTVEHVWKGRGRVDWSHYVRMMANLGALFDEDELEAQGANFLKSKEVKWIAAVARLLFDASDFYRWATSEGRGAADGFFSCISSHYLQVGPQELELTLTVQRGFEPCPEFFVVTRGSLTAYPYVLGLGPSEVEMSLVPEGAVYRVHYPAGGGRFAGLRKALMWPFAARTTANALKDAHEDLQGRFRELQSAQDALDTQARQLRTAFSIAELIHRDLDLDRTLTAVVDALVNNAELEAARIVLALDLEGRRVDRDVRASEPPSREPDHTVSLDSRGSPLGELQLWLTDSRDQGPVAELIEMVTPTVVMALDGALKFAAIADYRQNLEQKVTDRTTELRQTRDELADTVDELRVAQAAKDRIFSNINHEIRTPLSLVLLSVQNIRAAGPSPLPEDTVRQLDTIEHSATRLTRLVDGLLLLAAGEEGKLELRKAACDLGSLIEQMVTAWRSAAEAQGLNLAYSGSGRWPAHVDPGAIEQIIANLLSNAIKFTPRDGSVSVELDAAGQDIEIRVRDTGIGIDPELEKRVFGRFQQGTAPLHAASRGSGIGLSIVRELAEGHGGSVRVERVRGGGSVFIVRLPRGEVNDAPPMETAARAADFGIAESERRTSVVPCAGNARGTLLVAEDDPQLGRAVAQLLASEYRVLLAPDGVSALALADEHAPDLLVTDLEMPGMDGFELTRRFRQRADNRLAPVLLLTAHGDLADRLAGFDAGAVDYVLKPFHPEELLARVRSQLALRDMALRLHESAKLAALGGLVAGVAHELKNPANGVVNAVRPLKSMLPAELLEPGTPRGQLWMVLETCAEQIASLCKNLLELNRSGELERGPHQVSTLMAKSFALVQPALADVTLHDESEATMTVHCSGPLIVQVLSNLVENAAHAAGPGGWVSVAARATTEGLAVDVADGGGGVPRPLREKVFDPFFTTKPPGRGTGLGLTTARRIVERHGGRLEILDATTGTFFRMTLPAAQPHQRPNPEPPPEARPMGTP